MQSDVVHKLNNITETNQIIIYINCGQHKGFNNLFPLCCTVLEEDETQHENPTVQNVGPVDGQQEGKSSCILYCSYAIKEYILEIHLKLDICN